MDLLEKKFNEKIDLKEYTIRYRWAKLARSRDRKTLYQFITDDFLDTMAAELKADLPHFPKQISWEALEFTSHKLLDDIFDTTLSDYEWVWVVDGEEVHENQVDWVHGDTEGVVNFLIKDCQEVRDMYNEICEILENRSIRHDSEDLEESVKKIRERTYRIEYQRGGKWINASTLFTVEPGYGDKFAAQRDLSGIEAEYEDYAFRLV